MHSIVRGGSHYQSRCDSEQKLIGAEVYQLGEADIRGWIVEERR